MLIELWKDTDGYRLGIEEQSYDLSNDSYDRLIDALTAFREVAPGSYGKSEYELQDWDGDDEAPIV